MKGEIQYVGIIIIALILFSSRRLFWGSWGFWPFGGWGYRRHPMGPMGGLHGPMGGPGGHMKRSAPWK